MCSLVSYAYLNPETVNYVSGIDVDEFTIPASHINTGNSQLFEKATTIFKKRYTITISKVYLTQYWFRCTILIEDFDDDVEVTQTVVGDDGYEQGSGDPGTTSTMEVYHTTFGVEARSNVRLKASNETKMITVVYHFSEVVNNPTYDGDDYYVVLNFPYNDPETPPAPPITGINGIEIGEPAAIEYFDLMGRKLNGPQPGIVIEKQGNKTTKKIYK